MEEGGGEKERGREGSLMVDGLILWWANSPLNTYKIITHLLPKSALWVQRNA